jgi:outer membrane protein OmpA-like peptidoglycan-associated protein
MKYLISIGLVVTGATTAALAEPKPSQHPRVGQLAELTFPRGSAELAIDPDAKLQDKLGQVLAWATAHPDGLLVLDGHADRTGPARFNVQLSLERARTVRDQLITAGANPDQIVIAAFGEDGPRRDRSVVIWGTRAGMDAVIARTLTSGHAVLWSGPIEPEREPQPGVVARR